MTGNVITFYTHTNLALAPCLLVSIQTFQNKGILMNFFYYFFFLFIAIVLIAQEIHTYIQL